MRLSILSVLGFSLLSLGPVRARADIPEDMVKLMEKQSNDIDSNKPDCDKMLDALLKHADADAAMIKKAIASDQGKTPEQKKTEATALKAKYGPRLDAAVQKMGPLRAHPKTPKMDIWRKKLDPRPAPPPQP